MRPLETAFVFFLVSLWAAGPVQRGPRGWYLTAAAVSALCVAQMFLEGVRWQLVPAIVAVIMLWLPAAVVRFLLRAKVKKASGAEDNETLFPEAVSLDQLPVYVKRLRVPALVLSLTSGLLVFAFPIPSLPSPGGTYAVGTQTYDVVDNERRDVLAGEGPRHIIVQIWYPAASVPTAPRYSNYQPQTMDPAVLSGGVLGLVTSHLHLVRTNGIVSAPIADGRFPVVLYSPGLMSGRAQSTVLMEKLASNGYIVVALDHVYDAAFAVFPNGHVVLSQLLVGRASGTSQRIEQVGVQTRFDDVLSIYRWLQKQNAPAVGSASVPVIANHMDLDNCGIFGHSFGGITSIAVCCLPSVPMKCGISYDGNANFARTVARPFMFMEVKRPNDAFANYSVAKRSAGVDVYDVVFNEGGHLSFCDFGYFQPFHQFTGMTGTMPFEDAQEAMNAYTIAFFDKYLKGELQNEPAKLQFQNVECTIPHRLKTHAATR